jgi:hypothetical protein
MKKLIIISGLIIVASFILSGCGGNNQELKEKATKDSLEAVNVAAKILQVKLDSLAKQVTIDSLNKINAINEILGQYFSKEYNLRQTGGEEWMIDSESSPIMNLTISKIQDKIIFKHSYQGAEPHGCSGPHTDASAEMLGIEKVEDGIYKMNIKKLKCHFTEGAGCQGIDISENTPKNNSEFSITINLKNKNKRTFSSMVTKTKCSHAWDFNGLTFIKK